MGDIAFSCHHCGQSLAAPPDMANTTLDCPACGGGIRIPQPRRPARPEADQENQPPSPPERCPHCNAYLPSQAVICLACERNLKTGKRLRTFVEKPVRKPAHKLARKRTRVEPKYQNALMNFILCIVIVTLLIGGGLYYQKQKKDSGNAFGSQTQTTEGPGGTDSSRKNKVSKTKKGLVALLPKRFSETPRYSELQASADQVIQELTSDLRFEESAYRAINKRSEAIRKLVGILAEVEAAILKTEVLSRVQSVSSAAASDLRFEDSALRAIYKNDMAVFRMLGVWCQAVSGRYSSIMTVYSGTSNDIDSRMRFEDSAHRAGSIALDGVATSLGYLVAAYAGEAESSRIKRALLSSLRVEDSALRASTAKASASLDCLLVLVRLKSPSRATQIMSSVQSAVRFEDSTIRAHGQYKQGIVDALRFLIRNPPSME